MRTKINEYLEYQQKLRSELKEWVKDKSIPLEERWDVFIESELGNNDYSVINLDSYDLDDYLTSYERYEAIYVENIIEYIEDNYNNLYDEEIEEVIRNVKEELLERFIYSFKYDW